jgi:hypothetical protein
MVDVAIVVVVALVALGVGWAMQRRAPDVPTSPTHTVPTQIDRADFARSDTPWLVAVFTSDTCATCAKVWQAAQPLESDAVAVEAVEVKMAADLHERYEITAVPAVIMADHDGVVQGSFLGPPTTADLWAKLAELREGQG